MPDSRYVTPNGYVSFGKLSNCTLDACEVRYSIFQYKPSIAANSLFVALFATSMLLHFFQGFYAWRSKTLSTQWFYMWAVVLGCITEIIGYIGRILLHNNPFDFDDFLIQIVCLTIAPAFFSASIYITLGQTVKALGYPRFNPAYYTYIFIPSDIISIILQGAGGGLSSGSAGQKGVDVSLAGLSFQVFSLVVFILLVLDYAYHFYKSEERKYIDFTPKFKAFIVFQSLAVILILARSAYRIDELSSGYNGSLFHDEASFIVLEGVFISITAFLLNAANPSYLFDKEGQLIGQVGREKGVFDSPRREQQQEMDGSGVAATPRSGVIASPRSGHQQEMEENGVAASPMIHV